MQLFVHQQNILYFRRLLAEAPPETRRLQLVKLLTEEEGKSVADGRVAPGENPPAR
jgi:hypothetical protein